MKIRTYSELRHLKTFEERYEYLRLDGAVGIETFGFDRYLNQALYQSREWRKTRDIVIARDNACDLGIEGHEISVPRIIRIHHMNPITVEDVINRNPDIFNPEFLITTINKTHNAIHYGDAEQLSRGPVERKPNDTCPWR